MTDHVPYKCAGDHDERRGCMFCDGGLFACAICGALEGATPTDCPGVSMTPEQIDAIYAGELDYRCGEWLAACSPHTPAYWSTPEGRALIESTRRAAR